MFRLMDGWMRGELFMWWRPDVSYFALTRIFSRNEEQHLPLYLAPFVIWKKVIPGFRIPESLVFGAEFQGFQVSSEGLLHIWEASHVSMHSGMWPVYCVLHLPQKKSIRLVRISKPCSRSGLHSWINVLHNDVYLASSVSMQFSTFRGSTSHLI